MDKEDINIHYSVSMTETIQLRQTKNSPEHEQKINRKEEKVLLKRTWVKIVPHNEQAKSKGRGSTGN